VALVVASSIMGVAMAAATASAAVAYKASSVQRTDAAAAGMTGTALGLHGQAGAGRVAALRAVVVS